MKIFTQLHHKFSTLATPHTNPTQVNCHQPTILQKNYVLHSSDNYLLSKVFFVQVLFQVEFNLQLTCAL
jgi:hypothetical protein